MKQLMIMGYMVIITLGAFAQQEAVRKTSAKPVQHDTRDFDKVVHATGKRALVRRQSETQHATDYNKVVPSQRQIKTERSAETREKQAVNDPDKVVKSKR